MLEPEQGEANQGEQNIGIEDYTRIPRRKVVRCKHFSDMSARRAEQEERGPDNSSSAHIEAPAEREKADSRETQAREAHLGLEWAVRPTDQVRCHLAQKNVHYEVLEITECDREEDEVRKKHLNEHSGAPRAGLSQRRHRRGKQPNQQQRQREVLKKETDHVFHESSV
jgi:hypothetical protein